MLAGVATVFALLTPKFLTAANLVNVARQASINVVLAAGMTFVILVRGIDLAVGSVLGLSAVIALQISLLDSWSWAAVPASLGAGVVVGAATGAAVAYGGLPPFIITLGTYTALRGAAYLIAGGTSVINNDISFGWIGNDYLGPVPWLIVVAAVARRLVPNCSAPIVIKMAQKLVLKPSIAQTPYIFASESIQPEKNNPNVAMQSM